MENKEMDRKLQTPPLLSVINPLSYKCGKWYLSAILELVRDVGGTVVGESALRSAATLLSGFRAPPLVPGPDGGPKSLISPCCGLAIYKNQNLFMLGKIVNHYI
ncbi:hypothetical protein PoB_004240600 [Plakobranchus ocellatus]|uniref:Uncharacterized protein n=1 Tax=Plakobranchus ocellatus TaxID=259542 RepID=A0AAV4BAQ5_9GAST|nr:hypothetical protein PoB_004240600 [Plakobranchus ocellatus]